MSSTSKVISNKITKSLSMGMIYNLYFVFVLFCFVLFFFFVFVFFFKFGGRLKKKKKTHILKNLIRFLIKSNIGIITF